MNDPRTRQCPADELLAAFVDGRLSEPQRGAVVEHIDGCDQCHETVAATMAFRESEPIPLIATRLGRRNWLYAAAAMMLLAMAAVLSIVASHRNRSPLRELVVAANLLPSRIVTARISGGFDWRPPPDASRGGDDNSDPQRMRLQGAAGLLLQQNDKVSEDARGIAHLLTGNEEEAVASLQHAATVGKKAEAWSDLSAAYLTRNEKSELREPLLRALAAADESLRLEPTRQEALFNRALALERLQFRPEARAAWQHYIDADPSSGWTTEARQHLKALASVPQSESWPRQLPSFRRAAEEGREQLVADTVVRYAQQARSWSETIFASDWAEATLRGDQKSAAGALAAMGTVGNVLFSRSGDAFVRDAAAAIAAATDPSRRTLLARAYREYINGRKLYSRREVLAARAELEKSVLMFHETNSPMELAAAYYTANTVRDQGEPAEARLRLEPLRLQARAAHYIALDALAGWELGLCFETAADPQSARNIWTESLGQLQRLGEGDNTASLHSLLFGAAEQLGAEEEALAHLVEAARLFDLSGNERLRQPLLSAAAEHAQRLGETLTGRSLAALTLESARRVDDPLLIVSAAAESLAAAVRDNPQGDVSLQLEECAAADRRINDPALRQWSAAQLAFARALAWRPRRPELALQSIDESLRLTRQLKNDFAVPRLQLERCRIERSMGRLEQAAADCQASLQLVEEHRSQVTKTNERATMFAVNSEETIAELASLLLAQRKELQAFDVVERARGRALLDAMHRGPSTPLPGEEIIRTLAPSTAAISYLLLPDRVVIAVFHNGRFDAVSSSVAMPELTQEVRRLVSGLRTRGSDRDVAVSSALLYDRLILPIEPFLTRSDALILSCDPKLSAIPFAALRDRRHNSWLVERFSLQTAPSLTIALQPSGRPGENFPLAATLRCAAIADPRFDRQQHADLPRLPRAAAEGREVAALYRDSTLLTDAEATLAATGAALERSDVIHVAAHSLDDRHEPLRTAIVLADGDLTAGSISDMKLHNRLVVLSSCESGRPDAEMADGVQNLATAFLLAGARDVIATRWPLRDSRTTAQMMRALHSAIVAGLPPSQALRRVQIDALKGSFEGATVADWATLTLIGRQL